MARPTKSQDDSTEEVNKDIKFTLDTYDGESLIATPEYPDEMVWQFFGHEMPEHRWYNNSEIRGWVFPSTKPCIELLQSRFKEKRDYLISGAAKIIIQYKVLTDLVNQKKAHSRWDYLFNDANTDFVANMGSRIPFKHQTVAVEAMYNMEFFGLLMEMGTGKTSCVVAEVNRYMHFLDDEQIFRAIIICPKSLMTNWAREIDSCTSDAINYHVETLNKGDLKSIEQIMTALRSDAKLLWFIVSYDSVGTLLKQLKVLKFNYMACDESHYVKSSSSQRFKSVYELADTVQMRRILTGTPVSNNILDVWSQFQILRNGALGYTTFNAFKRKFAKIREVPGGFEQVVGFKNVDKLKENMASMSFIVRKERCLDLPQKMYQTVTVEMNEKHRKIYDDFASSFYVQLDSIGNKEAATEYIIVQMLKLSQICCGFISGTTKTTQVSADGIDEEVLEKEIHIIEGGDTKLIQMMDDIEECVNEGSKVIVWSRFKRDNREIKKRLLEQYKIESGVFDSGTKPDERQVIIDRFNRDDSFRVFIGNAGAGGVGITLLGSEKIPVRQSFYYSNDFQYGKRIQSEDRCHRIGLRNSILYKDYVYLDTIEQYIAECLQKKKDVSDAVKNVGEIKELLLRQRG